MRSRTAGRGGRTHHARRRDELLPDTGSHRLLALCNLMSERWLDALEEARCAGEST